MPECGHMRDQMTITCSAFLCLLFLQLKVCCWLDCIVKVTLICTIAAQGCHGLEELLSHAAYYISALWSNVYARSFSTCLNHTMPALSRITLHKTPKHWHQATPWQHAAKTCNLQNWRRLRRKGGHNHRI